VPYPIEERTSGLEGIGLLRVVKDEQTITVPVLISARTRGDVIAIEEALWEFLQACGYSKSDASSRVEFEGTAYTKFYLRLKWKDFELEFGREKDSNSSSESTAPKKHKAREFLDKTLAAVGGLLILGTAMLAAISYAREFVRQYHETFPPTSAAQIEMTQEDHRIIEVKLPPAIVPAIENADKDVETFKLLTGFVLADQLHVRSESSQHPANPD
jgi:hypothetical protein